MAFRIQYDNFARAQLHSCAAQFEPLFLTAIEVWLEQLAENAESDGETLASGQPDLVNIFADRGPHASTQRELHRAGIRSSTKFVQLRMPNPNLTLPGIVTVIYQIRRQVQQIHIISFFELPWIAIEHRQEK